MKIMSHRGGSSNPTPWDYRTAPLEDSRHWARKVREQTIRAQTPEIRAVQDQGRVLHQAREQARVETGMAGAAVQTAVRPGVMAAVQETWAAILQAAEVLRPPEEIHARTKMIRLRQYR